MAPGPSTGWKFMVRILKASRHKAVRTLKAADKTDEIDQSADREIALPESLVKQTVLSSSTRQKRSQRDRSSDRSQRIKSALQALGFLSFCDDRPPAVQLTTPVQQWKPFIFSLIGYKSQRRGHFKPQTLHMITSTNMMGFTPNGSVFSIQPMLTLFPEDALLSHDDEGTITSVDPPHPSQSNNGIDFDLLTYTNSTISANASTQRLQELTCTEVDTKEELSRNSSFSSTSSSDLFDGPVGQASNDEFGLEMVVTGMEPHSNSMREESSTCTTTMFPEQRPEERTLLQPDIRSF